jgi:hypothetical protein
MSKISDEELKRLLLELEELEELPEGLAARMDETIDRLAAAEKNKRNSRLSSTSWALAAGFTLVFGLGVVLNLESSPLSQGPSTNSSQTPQQTENDVLTSTESAPKMTSKPVMQYSSIIDYSKDIKEDDLPFEPSNNFGALSELPSKIQSCLISLGLNDSVSLVDRANYGDQKITAVWSAISQNSWQVYIIDSRCEGITEVLVNAQK